MSQSISLEPVKVDCETASAANADNTTLNRFMEAVPKMLTTHRSLTFDPAETMIHYKSAIDIRVANSTEDTKLATWTTEKGFALLPGVTMEQDKRFFRIGVIDDVCENRKKKLAQKFIE